MNNELQNYLEQFQQMNRASLRGKKAPHKPVLLLSIIALIEAGKITSNKVVLTDELVNTFEKLWKVYVEGEERATYEGVAELLEFHKLGTYPFKCSIVNPFFHMSNEPFWKLVRSPQWKERRTPSLKSLRTDYLYAEMEENLFSFLLEKDKREEVQRLLVQLI